MGKATKALAAGTVIAVMVTAVIALYYYYQVRGHGRIKTVGIKVYKDAGCTTLCKDIDWGLISPGEVKKATVYIKNTGNAPVNLTISTSNWNPVEASNYLSISWNYTGEIINPSNVIAADIFLSVSQDITGVTNFSHYITITAGG